VTEKRRRIDFRRVIDLPDDLRRNTGAVRMDAAAAADMAGAHRGSPAGGPGCQSAGLTIPTPFSRRTRDQDMTAIAFDRVAGRIDGPAPIRCWNGACASTAAVFSSAGRPPWCIRRILTKANPTYSLNPANRDYTNSIHLMNNVYAKFCRNVIKRQKKPAFP
jgi:hypothetical protein